MIKGNRRRFSEDQKVEAIKQHLVGKENISTICNHLRIHPNQFYEWQRIFFENIAPRYKFILFYSLMLRLSR